MIKAKRRFTFGGQKFRITKEFSYGMSYEAFCQGYVAPDELIGKNVEITGEYGTKQQYQIIEVASKVMAVPGRHMAVFDGENGYVKRTYITVIDADQGRQWWYYWQRNWRGFDGSDMWNLDRIILDWLVPRLKRFAQAGCQGWPTMVHGQIEYLSSEPIMKEIVEGFELLQKNYNDEIKQLDSQQVQKVNRAFNLFKGHFGDLWT